MKSKLPMSTVDENGNKVYQCPYCDHQSKTVQGMMQGHLKYFCEKKPK